MKTTTNWIKENIKECQDEIFVLLGFSPKNEGHTIHTILANPTLFDWADSHVTKEPVWCEWCFKDLNSNLCDCQDLDSALENSARLNAMEEL